MRIKKNTMNQNNYMQSKVKTLGDLQSLNLSFILHNYKKKKKINFTY